MTEGFALYSLDHPDNARKLRAQLLQAKSDQVMQIAQPGIVKNWEDYKQRIGRLQGLDDALRLCDDMDKQQDERGSKNARGPKPNR